MNTKSVVVTAVANHADPNDPEAVAQAEVTSHWAAPYVQDGDIDPTEPFSDMYYPVLENAIENVVVVTDANSPETNNNNNSGGNYTSPGALGNVAFSFYWRHALKNILPPQSTGLIVVFDNPCGDQHFTYQIDGPDPTFLGFGDLHPKEDRFEEMAQSSSLALLTKSDPSYTGVPMNPDFCPFTLTVYPSIDMERKFVTAEPILYSVFSAMIFIFVAALFFVYDGLVRREFNAKQKLLEAKRHFMRFVSHEVRSES